MKASLALKLILQKGWKVRTLGGQFSPSGVRWKYEFVGHESLGTFVLTDKQQRNLRGLAQTPKVKA